LRDLSEAEELDALQAAANELDPNELLSALGLVVQSIEEWYQGQFHIFVKTEAAQRRLRPDRWMAVTPGWLRDSSRGPLNALIHSCTTFQSAAEDFAEFQVRWSGFGGALRGFIRGATDPADGLSALFGESSIDKEGKQAERRLKSALKTLWAAIDTAQESVDYLVVTRWNSEVSRVTAEMDLQLSNLQSSSRTLLLSGGSADSTSARPRSLSGVLWATALLIVLALALGSYILWGRGQDLTESLPQAEMITLPSGTLRSGPAESFDVVAEIKSSVFAKVLDRTVPGWLKVELAAGETGWIPRNPLPSQ